MRRLIAIAPMMKYSDRHGRYFLRLMSPHADLYTEMITGLAVTRGRSHLLDFDPLEHPVALQLGGNQPDVLAEAARLGEAYGYDEINLNVGCPSSRVQSGQFGACLFKSPDHVARCIEAMQSAVNIPVTVKTRTGVDDSDSYQHLHHFIKTVGKSGCRVFMIHARKAWLKGLNPKQNRNIPPLEYGKVRHIKQDFPQYTVIINGGIQKVSDVQQHLSTVDGVMIGRAAYNNPKLLAQLEPVIFNTAAPTIKHVLSQFRDYIENQRIEGVAMNQLLKPILGLVYGQTGGRHIRRLLTDYARNNDIVGLSRLLQKLPQFINQIQQH